MEFSLPASRTAFPFERLLILQLIIFSPQLFAQQKGRVFPFFLGLVDEPFSWLEFFVRNNYLMLASWALHFYIPLFAELNI